MMGGSNTRFNEMNENMKRLPLGEIKNSPFSHTNF